MIFFTFKELRTPSEAPPRCRILVAVGTHNNFRSAEPVFSDLPGAAIFTFHNYATPGVPHLKLFKSYMTGWIALIALPLLLTVERRPHVRRSMRMRLDHLALSLSSHHDIRKFMQESGAEVFVTLSNLAVYNNILVEAARQVGMTTVFMTHAPVGRGQVPLETDVALLDGEFQKRLYPPGRAKMIVTGSMRGSNLVQAWQDRSGENGVIVATNALNRDLGEIERFVEKLLRIDLQPRVVVRPHPADSGRFEAHRRLCRRTGADYSDPRSSLFDSAKNCKYLVTGVSGVAVDALLIGLYPLILRDSDLKANCGLPEDYYGLFELKLARQIDLAAPRLPRDWVIGRELELLEAASSPNWSAKEKIAQVLDSILRGSDAHNVCDGTPKLHDAEGPKGER
ncbi:hypothetical protein G7A66_10120 [Altererythrobacter sp. SALINAS58]|uniref:hypothetical protein n=1 Tax=Alteripontixanthobacter muriae TaxID=2705546 RepID=UPI0015767102|nr:hypothetical protein [Alteripontixanthobacter muriae]NTZ43428.1 hypothetical protein [Alteripontixanthobacter muriae]